MDDLDRKCVEQVGATGADDERDPIEPTRLPDFQRQDDALMRGKSKWHVDEGAQSDRKMSEKGTGATRVYCHSFGPTPKCLSVGAGV